MKAHVVSLLLFVSSTLMAGQTLEVLENAKSLIGRVRIGDHKGAICRLDVRSFSEDIYSLRYETVYSEYGIRHKKPILLKSLEFPVRNYGGDVAGSNIKTTARGQKKTVISLFYDSRTQAYKAILHENDIGVETVNTGKYTVCEGMQPR